MQLKVLGKLLTTLSPTFLTPKTAVNLRVREDGQLQLAPPTQGREQAAKPANAAATAAMNTAVTGGTISTRNTQALSDGLKTYLPSQQVLSRSITELQNFAQAINQRGVGKQSPELTQLLTRLTNIIGKAPTIEQLIQPKGLQHSVKHSGVFLESQLRQLSANTRTTLTQTRPATSFTAQTPTQTSTLPPNVPTASPSSNTLSGSLNANLSTGNRTTRPADTAETDIKYNDLKAELLRVQSDINRLVTTSAASRNANIDKLLQSLFSFVPGGGAPKPKLPMPQVHSQLASALQPSIFSALARITSLQLRHLIQSQQEVGLSPLGGFLELPVRVGEHVYPLTLNIQERVHEKPEEEHTKNAKDEEKKRRKITKRWQVFMEFDLDELGTFAGDIRVEDEHVTTQLWVQKTALWQASHQHLNTLKHELENSGITVDAISCHQGKAPEQSIRVQQSLVDIRT